jgi:acyl carrier protein phosphodiesterase
MNFLGHLYFSNNDTALMKANLLGDFVKGNKFELHPKMIQKGIKLHREIDHYIDNHPKVNELQRKLQSELPKVVSVATDLYFDHILAREWLQFHPKTLDQFLEHFYEDSLEDVYDFAPKFEEMLVKMRKFKWINQYATLDGLEKLCQGVGKRLSFDNALTVGQPIFIKHQKLIEETFFSFMKDANIHLVDLASK